MFGPRFTLFADVLLVGVLTFVASLPIVTAYAAFVAACRVLSPSSTVSVSGYGRAFAAAARSHPGVLGFPLLLLGDVWALAHGAPGGPFLAGTLGVIVLLGLAAAACWEPGVPWSGALRAAGTNLLRYPTDAALLVAAMVVAAVLSLSVPLMITLVPGVLALAAVATTRRRPSRSGALPRAGS